MQKMNKKKNIILLDSAPQKEWNFRELLEKHTGKAWEIWHINSHFSDHGLKKKAKFFAFPLKLLLHRKELDVMLSYQQFYGLVYAWYCELFHLKKRCRVIVTTFIYRPKKGIIGKLYFRFMKRAVHSRHIDQIVCFSGAEPEYYKKLFTIKENKFIYVPFGTADIRETVEKQAESREEFILSVGKSNRDYDFLVDSLKNTDYDVRILSDTYFRKDTGKNIQLFHDVFGTAYYEMLAQCRCVVVPLDDVHISAGQFVFLQSMMFGKPVIVTASDTVGDYIENERTGFIIEKEKEALLEILERLYRDKELYREISENARKSFEEKYSLEHMAEQLGWLCCQMEECDR